MARFLRYVKPHWRKALIVSATILIGTAAQLTPPYLIKILVDDVLMGDGGVRLLFSIVAGLMGIQLLATVLTIIRGRLAAWLGSRIMHDVRFDFYQAIQGLSLRRYDKTPTGSLLSRLTGDTTMLNDAFIFLAFMILPSILQIVGICLILLMMDLKLGALVLTPAPLVVGLTLWFYRRLHGYYHRWWQCRSKMSALANDAISGMRVVKAFSQEPAELTKFGGRSHAFFQAWARGGWTLGDGHARHLVCNRSRNLSRVVLRRARGAQESRRETHRHADGVHRLPLHVLRPAPDAHTLQRFHEPRLHRRPAPLRDQ